MGQKKKGKTMFQISFDDSKICVIEAPDGQFLVQQGPKKAKYATVTKIISTNEWACTLFDDEDSAKRHANRLLNGHDKKRFASVNVVAIKEGA